MAETTADVRRDIEMTRERMSETLAQLEQKLDLMRIVKDHPWPALAAAFGAGVLLSGSRTDVRAAAATVAATRGASSRLGEVLDDVVANLMTGVSAAFQDRVDALVGELKTSLGAPTGRTGAPGTTRTGAGPANAQWTSPPSAMTHSGEVDTALQGGAAATQQGSDWAPKGMPNVQGNPTRAD